MLALWKHQAMFVRGGAVEFGLAGDSFDTNTLIVLKSSSVIIRGKTECV